MNVTRGKGATWVARREIDHRARSMRPPGADRDPARPAGGRRVALSVSPYLAPTALVVLRVGVLFCSAILGEERLPFCSGVLGSTADHLQR